MVMPKKKGPKGPKRALEGDVRGGNEPTNQSHPMPLNANPRHEIRSKTPPQNAGQHIPYAPNHEASGFQTSPLVSVEIIESCLDAFFAHKYPLMPILDREQIYALLPLLHDLPEQYALFTALCAVIMVQPEIPLYSSKLGDLRKPLSIDSRPSVDFLINETCRARNFCNHAENPSLAAVQTSFFLFAACFGLEKDNSAWFYIRESMTLLQLLRLHEEATYSTMADPRYSTYCRRTFWLLFITERAYALQRHRPATLQGTISLPTVDPGPEATILSGFLDLVSLFQNFNDSFLALWNFSAHATTSLESLIKLQDNLKRAIPNVSERTQIQQADLLISRQWLKTLVWQLCVSKGVLSSKPANESMSFHYPATIARDLFLASRLFPPQALEANGVGILEKVFDIGCSLADVLLVDANVIQVSAMDIGPRDYLIELVAILGTSLGGSSKYPRLLAAKADECLQVRIRSLPASDDSYGSGETDWYEDADADDAHVVYGSTVYNTNGLRICKDDDVWEVIG
jgi:hypothetical protein